LLLIFYFFFTINDNNSGLENNSNNSNSNSSNSSISHDDSNRIAPVSPGKNYWEKFKALWAGDDNHSKSPTPEGMHSPETTPPPACPTPSEAPTEDFADTEVRTTPLPTTEALLASYKNPEDIIQFGKNFKVLIDNRREADRSDAKKALLSDPDMTQELYLDLISTIDKQYTYELSLVKGRVKEALDALGVNSDSGGSGDSASDGVVEPASGGSGNESEYSNNESSGGSGDSASDGVANQLATQEFSSSSSSKKRRRESSEDGIGGEPAPKRFKQDSSDITGEGEPFDFGGGDD